MKFSVKSIISLSCFAVVIASACSTDEMAYVNDQKPTQELSFEGSFESCEDSKSFFDSNNKYVFSSGDALSVFDGENNYKFVTNETGSNVTFTGSASVSENFGVLYPYQENASFSNNVIIASIPFEQVATINTYDPASYLSVSKIDASKMFSLKHACTRILFNATERFVSVTFKGNNNEDVAGNVNITVSETPSCSIVSNGSKEITLKAKEGTASPGQYVISTVPQSFPNGITLILTREDGTTVEKAFNKNIVLYRNGRTNTGTLGEDRPDYLRFTANEASTIAMSGNGSIVDIEYSTNATSWTAWDLSAINLSAGQTVYFRGDNLQGFGSASNYYQFVMTGSLSAAGDIMSLIYGKSTGYITKRATIPSPYCFYKLFADCAALQNAPDMPATILTNDCYSNMYLNCTSLKSAVLPASELVKNCYNQMFQGCTSLESIEVGFTKETYFEKVSKKYWYTTKWLYQASPSGTVFINLDSALASSNVNTVPSGWTITSY